MTLSIEMRMEARPETVFSYLTDPEKYRRWQGRDAELDPRPGGIFSINLTPRATIRGNYVEVEPPRRLVFTWGWELHDDAVPSALSEVPAGSTTVEITLEPDGDATIFRLSHDGLGEEPVEVFHGWGWDLYLGRLAIAVTGADPGPDTLQEMLDAGAVPFPGT